MDRLESFLARMVKNLEAYSMHQHDDQPPAFVLLKTTTLPLEHEEKNKSYHAKEVLAAQAAGLNVTDVYAVTQAIHDANISAYAHVDGGHFQPFVYEQFNDLLLNQLCPN